jgi:alpha-L-fucosidase 2
MIFGGIASERIQLNEDTVWAGEKRDRSNPEGAKSLGEVRRLLFAGKVVEAEKLADQTIISIQRPCHPTGRSRCFHFQDLMVLPIMSELDLETTVARVSYEAEERGSIAVFSSEGSADCHQADVRPARTNLIPRDFTREQDSRTRAENDTIVMEGQAVARDDRHEQERKVRSPSGMLRCARTRKMHAEGGELIVEQANAATLYFAAATNARNAIPQAKCREDLLASRKNYNTLLKEHISAHQSYFSNVDLRLDEVIPDLPTDERLKRIDTGATLVTRQNLYFQFGRYLLISVAPGTANLQGI